MSVLGFCLLHQGYFPISMKNQKYTLDLLFETGMLGCNLSNAPLEANVHISSKTDDLVDKGQYQRFVGKLIYLSHTHPDIAFDVSLVSQYMHDPYSSHLEAVFWILCYLKFVLGKEILLSSHGYLQVEAFTDSDWASSLDYRRSTTGYGTFVGDNLVTWRSKKQAVFARSSAQAEFLVMSHGIYELMWLQGLLKI
ncbi:uncharacterized mitochondrial protein AtMg00810-like [Telopea speciosissima]|uniref:uncharacterized mitochondrial protein AtMg00810-like n=1 Tax=Telopea speciosissima TaxID=54955 RepID=UPI001CC52E8D|nr:uncharacterized mitochondrial protein AtMg00810-like [Telopea speciosissima]